MALVAMSPRLMALMSLQASTRLFTVSATYRMFGLAEVSTADGLWQIELAAFHQVRAARFDGQRGLSEGARGIRVISNGLR